MTIINDVLNSPESGWERYDLEPPFANLLGAWSSTNSRPENFTGGSIRFTTTFSSSLTFEFYGEGLRLVVERNQGYDNLGEIEIDGAKSDFSCYENISTYKGKVLAFEKTGLDNTKKHTVTIRKTSNDTKPLNVDSVDINTSSRLVIKNPTTDELYSLSDNTLIHLPDNTNESIIEHGIEKGKFIQLDVPFTKHRHFNNTPVDGTSSKVFTHDVGKINTLNIKEIKEDKYEPIYTWYNTNMTSNTAPIPLVASASSEYNTTYQAWKAFDGIKDINAWLTVANTITGWLKLDFGRKVIINVLKMTCRGGTTDAITKAMPKDFDIYGSNDNSTYSLLGTISNQINWSFLEERLFVIHNSVEYRYLRLNILNNNGSTEYSNIGELIYGYKREVN